MAIDEAEKEKEGETEKNESLSETPPGQVAEKASEGGEEDEKTSGKEEEIIEAQKSDADQDRIKFEDMKRAHAEVINEKDRENALLKKQLEEARRINAERQNQPGKHLLKENVGKY